jgi:hypothetical protein
VSDAILRLILRFDAVDRSTGGAGLCEAVRRLLRSFEASEPFEGRRGESFGIEGELRDSRRFRCVDRIGAHHIPGQLKC